MDVLSLLQNRFAAALDRCYPGQFSAEQQRDLLDMIRPAQDPRFGDYQANCAMPLGKQLSRPPRDVAAQLVAGLEISDFCQECEIAGPGFINLRLRTDWLETQLARLIHDERLGVEPAESPLAFVIDFSAPNVAKPMHVGHIRSTVIGDSLYRTLKFLGHNVIGDNHIGDWGTQFGMILFGYRNFRDDAAYRLNPVQELARLYRVVNTLVDYHGTKGQWKDLTDKLRQREEELQRNQAQAKGLSGEDAKRLAKTVRRMESLVNESREELESARRRIEAVEQDPPLHGMALEFPRIGEEILEETARLHAGDPENTRLWREFMPPCLDALERVYRRLGVKFDVTLGESFYHEQLASVVRELRELGVARESEGAICVFLSGHETPMIIQKQDGAYLYATSDLATIRYRLEKWNPDSILYVVDHRQGTHFEQLFATAQLWGKGHARLMHVNFGTVLGQDGRPFKTRSGDTVGLEGLLDEGVQRALAIVRENDDRKPDGPELDETERQQVAERVGIAALKYADLSQNRSSDYVFSFDKMLAMNGNTATYMQYAYARVRSIFRRGNVDVSALRQSSARIELAHPAERELALELMRFPQALSQVVADFRPHFLTTYLFALANRYSTFFENCPVLKAQTSEQKNSRLLLCDLTSRTIAQGLRLLGIEVVERM